MPSGRRVVLLDGPALAADACGPQLNDTLADVATVFDALELRLADGRLLWLAGLDPPRATAADLDLRPRPELALKSEVTSAVVVRSLTAEPDRWNRIPVLLSWLNRRGAGHDAKHAARCR